MEETRLLEPLFEMYLIHRLGMAAENTVRQFRITLAHFAKFVGRPATTADLTDEMVLRFMRHRVKVDGKAIRTANKHRDNLLALWRFLARKQLVDHWPDVDPFPEPQREPLAWGREQLAALFTACNQQTGKIAGVAAAPWWLALHSVLWDTGERIGAIMQAEWRQVDLADRWLLVPAEHRKGKRKDKAFRLHRDTVVALESIRLPSRGLVFPFDRTYTTLWHRYGLILKRAGLPFDRSSKFHRVRKSAASWFEAAGGNATALLGHSSRRVTERYLDPRIVGASQASDTLFRPECRACD